MKISLCLTTYNRFELLKESFAQVLDDSRIDDIIILDDCSTDGSFEKIVEHYKDIPKVRIIRQAQNRGMSLNKRDAIGYAKNEWCIILDSDNIIGPDYLDSFYDDRLKHNWKFENGEWQMLGTDTIFCPSFAKPEFDYSEFSGFTIDIIKARNHIKNDRLNMCLNTCNYIVHRDSYLKAYKHNPAHIASDTIWFAYNWLQQGGSFYIVPGMEYFHRIHKGSGFLQNADHNMRMAQSVRQMIMAL